MPANTRAHTTAKASQALPATKIPEGGPIKWVLNGDTSEWYTEKDIACSTTKKRNISDVDSDPNLKSEIPIKKSRPPAQGIGPSQRQQRRQSASPVTPPKGPRKQTNERPGLIGKKRRRTKEEVAAERAAKEAEVQAAAEAKVDAVASLAKMELDQEQQETTCRRQILWRQPSVLDVTAYSSGEDFDWGPVDDEKETDESEMGGDTDTGSTNLSAEVAMAKQSKVSTSSDTFE